MKKNIIFLGITIILLFFYRCRLCSNSQQTTTHLDCSYANFFRTEFDIYTITICQYHERISMSEISTILQTNKGMRANIHIKKRFIDDKGVQIVEKDTIFYLNSNQYLRIRDFEYQLKKDSFSMIAPFVAGSGSTVLISYNTYIKKYDTKHIISLYDELVVK